MASATIVKYPDGRTENMVVLTHFQKNGTEVIGFGTDKVDNGHKVIGVSYLDNNLFQNIIDASKWDEIKGYLVDIIHGRMTDVEYLDVPVEVLVSTDVYRPLGLREENYQSIVTNYEQFLMRKQQAAAVPPTPQPEPVTPVVEPAPIENLAEPAVAPVTPTPVNTVVQPPEELTDPLSVADSLGPAPVDNTIVHQDIVPPEGINNIPGSIPQTPPVNNDPMVPPVTPTFDTTVAPQPINPTPAMNPIDMGANLGANLNMNESIPVNNNPQVLNPEPTPTNVVNETPTFNQPINNQPINPTPEAINPFPFPNQPPVTPVETPVMDNPNAVNMAMPSITPEATAPAPNLNPTPESPVTNSYLANADKMIAQMEEQLKNAKEMREEMARNLAEAKGINDLSKQTFERAQNMAMNDPMYNNPQPNPMPYQNVGPMPNNTQTLDLNRTAA